MCILVYVFFSLFPPLLWRRWWVGGLCWWWCESRRSQPDQRRHICSLRLRYHRPPPDTSSPPFLPLPKTKNKTNKHCHSNPPLPPPRGQCIPYQGWPHQPLHKHAHTQSHTAASQSLCPGEVCFCFFLFFFSFFVFFSLFWGSLLLLLGKGKGLFHCVCLYFFNMGTEIGGEVW